MTVPSTTRRAGPFTGTGIPTTYPFAFRVFEEADVAVTIADTDGVEITGVLNSDFVVTLNVDQDTSPGGFVQYAIGGIAQALPAGYILGIDGAREYSQEADLPQGGNFNARAVEDALDNLAIQIQQIRDSLDRSVRLTVLSPLTTDSTLPIPEAVALLGWNSAGTALQNYTPDTAVSTDVLRSDLADAVTLAHGDALIGSRRNLTNAISSTVDARLEWQYLNAKEWGIKLDGATDDSAAWALLLADLPASNFVLCIPPGTSLVSQAAVNGIKFNGKSNFAVFANGATIKVKNSEAVTGNHEILFFSNCQDAVVYGLTIDGNRANRTPVEVGAHSIVIADSCARLTFRDVVSKNAVVDGWIAYTTVPGTQSTYPTDIVLENCVADNCWRNGLSVIDSVRFTVRGGRYVNTNGTAPQSGIDIEPDASSTFGNTDCVVEFATLSGNTGYGLQSGGVTTGANTRLTLRALRGASNTQGFLNIGSGTDVLVEAPRVGPHSACTRSIIDFGSLVTNPTLIDATFDAITAGATKSLVYVHASVAGRPTIRGLKSNSSTSKILDINKGADISAISSVGCTTDAIVVGAGVRSVLRDIDITTCTGRGIYTAAADTEIDGATLVDCASTTASVQFDTTATGGVAENIDIVQTSSIPVGAVGIYWNAVPRRMRNVTARSAGTDYTATTIATFGAGVAGSKVFDCVPHPLAGSATFNPGAIAAAGVAGVNITVTGAELATATKHDEVLVFAATDYTNLVMSAFITGANTVRVNFSNNTGAGITPASATLYAEVHKR